MWCMKEVDEVDEVVSDLKLAVHHTINVPAVPAS